MQFAKVRDEDLNKKLHMFRDLLGYEYADPTSPGSFESAPIAVDLYANTSCALMHPTKQSDDFSSLGQVDVDGETVASDALVDTHALRTRGFFARYFSSKKHESTGFECAIQNLTNYLMDRKQRALEMQVGDGRVAMGQSFDALSSFSIDKLANIAIQCPLSNESTPLNPADKDFLQRAWADIVLKYCPAIRDASNDVSKDDLCEHYVIYCYGEDGERRIGGPLYIVGTPKSNPMPKNVARLQVHHLKKKQPLATSDAAASGKAHGGADAMVRLQNPHAHAEGGFAVTALVGLLAAHKVVMLLFIVGTMMLMVYACTRLVDQNQESFDETLGNKTGRNLAMGAGTMGCFALGFFPLIFVGGSAWPLIGCFAALGVASTFYLAKNTSEENGGGRRSAGGDDPIFDNAIDKYTAELRKMKHQSKQDSTFTWLPITNSTDADRLHYAMVVHCRKQQVMVPFVLSVQRDRVENRPNFIENQLFSQTWELMVRCNDTQSNAQLVNSVATTNEHVAGQKDGPAQVSKAMKKIHGEYSPLWKMFKKLFKDAGRPSMSQNSTMNLFKLVDVSCCDSGKRIASERLCDNAFKILSDKLIRNKASGQSKKVSLPEREELMKAYASFFNQLHKCQYLPKGAAVKMDTRSIEEMMAERRQKKDLESYGTIVTPEYIRQFKRLRQLCRDTGEGDRATTSAEYKETCPKTRSVKRNLRRLHRARTIGMPYSIGDPKSLNDIDPSGRFTSSSSQRQMKILRFGNNTDTYERFSKFRSRKSNRDPPTHVLVRYEDAVDEEHPTESDLTDVGHGLKLHVDPSTPAGIEMHPEHPKAKCKSDIPVPVMVRLNPGDDGTVTIGDTSVRCHDAVVPLMHTYKQTRSFNDEGSKELAGIVAREDIYEKGATAPAAPSAAAAAAAAGGRATGRRQRARGRRHARLHSRQRAAKKKSTARRRSGGGRRRGRSALGRTRSRGGGYCDDHASQCSSQDEAMCI